MFFQKKTQFMIDTLSAENNDLKKQSLKLESEVHAKNEEIANLSAKLTSYRNAMERLSLIYSPESQVAHEHYDELKKIWEYWDLSIHEREEQLQRQQRACAINYTPLSIDALLGCATFRGTDSDYTTYLTSCTCMDFQRHAFPCKHMYRLAYELNLFYLDDVLELPKTYNIINMNSFKKIVNRLPKYQYETLYDIFSESPLVFEKTTTISKLLESGLVQISSDNEAFLSSFTKEKLLAHMPTGYKKSISKPNLILDIINNYPDVITEFQNFFVALEPSISISHLVYQAKLYLEHLL